ncbi:phosphatase PAP2 family protein [Agromyces seonyuensis]|uniref:Phosphatase PAP2 family protein n=1 Tax=Agromyces seonyuensis TaxID=2662446 RepID=A0A6I4NZU2_9MICO|nr:phosphatase PAP2 family protein [Agromyces seonyuensis]MWB99843.1 phosphatase PAP2 family protein [Agromyces seonyuensis]
MGEPDERAPLHRRRGRIAAGIVALVAAVLVGVLVVGRTANTIDEAWMRGVLAIRGPVGEWLALVMDTLGGGVVGVFLVPVGIALALLAARRPWAACFSIVAAASSALVVQILKQVFGRARPEDMLVQSDYGSFPSGHTANAATIAVTFAVLFPRVWVIVAGAAYTVLMALSRTYLGAHWLSDTLGGALVGAGTALLVWAAFAHVLDRESAARARGPSLDA